MSARAWSHHVVAILRQHPRRDELSLEEVSRLGERVLELLTGSGERRLRARAESWQPEGLSEVEREILYGATWVEAARMWRESLE